MSESSEIDRLCDQFEAAWEAGRELSIEDCLDRVPEAARPALLTELLQVELWWRRDDLPSLETCLERFPCFRQAVEKGFSSFKLKTLPPIGNVDVTLDSEPDSDTTIDSASSREPSVGDNVRYFGDYELLEEIARGGMGVVYKARQINLKRTVALKMILAGRFAGEGDVQRFYTEAEAAANLDHPGIVPIFEIGEHQGQHYFSMAYVEGESLAQKVTDGPLPPSEAAETVKRICHAMAYAHERGVIHRDLKPANILIDANGQPKVTDFGLAKKPETDSNLTGTGQILGTPAYMPPEQAAGKTDEIGTLADVYSAGAILYCLTTGRPPFQSATAMDTILQVLDAEPVAPSAINPSTPKDLETICLKCLQKVSHHRYHSMQDLADELSRYLKGEPIVARPISTPARTWRWCKRNPVIAGLVLAVTLALVTGTAVASFFAAAAIEQAGIAVKAKEVALENARDMRRETIRADDSSKRAQREANNAKLKTLEAYSSFAQSKLNQARSLWNSSESNRRRKALELLDQSMGLLHDSNNLTETLEPQLSTELDSNTVFWSAHRTLVRSETIRWMTNTSFRKLSETEAGSSESYERRMIWSRDGKYWAQVTETRPLTIQIWDADSGLTVGKVVTRNPDDRIQAGIAFSNDRSRLLLAYAYEYRFFRVETWSIPNCELASTSDLLLPTDSRRGSRMMFSPQGDMLMCGDTAFRLADARKLYQIGEDVEPIGFSYDGKRLYTVDGNHQLNAFELKSGQQVESSIIAGLGIDAWVHSRFAFAASPQGDRVAVFSRNEKVILFDPVERRLIASIPVSVGSQGGMVSFHGTGSALFILDSEKLNICDSRDGSTLHQTRHPNSSNFRRWQPTQLLVDPVGTTTVAVITRELENDSNRFLSKLVRRQQSWDINLPEQPLRSMSISAVPIALDFLRNDSLAICDADGNIFVQSDEEGLQETLKPWRREASPENLSFDPSGRTLVRRLRSGVEAWAPESCTLLKRFDRNAIVSVNNRFVAEPGPTGKLRTLYDTTTRSAVPDIDDQASTRRLMFSSSGKYFACQPEEIGSSVLIYDSATGKRLGRMARVQGFFFSRDESALIAKLETDSTELRLARLDLLTMETLEATVPSIRQEYIALNPRMVSSNGVTIALHWEPNQSIYIVNFKTDSVVLLDGKWEGHALTLWVNNSRLIITERDRESFGNVRSIRLVDSEVGKELLKLTGVGNVEVFVSVGASHFAVGSRNAVGSIELRDVSNGQIVKEVDNTRITASSPDGRYLGCEGNGQNILLDIGSAAVTELGSDLLRGVSPDGKHVLVIGDKFNQDEDGFPISIAGRMESASQVIGADDGCVTSMQFLEAQLPTFSPDGQRVICQDVPTATVGVYNLRDFKIERQVPVNLRNRLLKPELASGALTDSQAVVSSDGKYLTLELNGISRVIDLDNGTITGLLDPPSHSLGITGLSVSEPDQIVCTASDDNTVMFWDLNSGDFLHVVESPSDVLSVDVASKSRSFVTCDLDGVVRFWSYSYDVIDEKKRFTAEVKWKYAASKALEARFAVDEEMVVVRTESGSLELVDSNGVHERSIEFGTASANSFCVHRDTIIVALDSGAIQILETRSGRVLDTIDSGYADTRDITTTSDGSLIATAGDGVRIWNSATHELLINVDWLVSPSTKIRFSDDRKRVAWISSDKTYTLMDLDKINTALKTRNLGWTQR